MKRRGTPRFPLSISVTLLDQKGENKLRGTAENVSEEGFLFLPDDSSKKLIEKFLYPRMSVKVMKEGKETSGEIRWCEKDLKDSTHLGILLKAPIGNIGVPLPVGELNNESLNEFSKNIKNKVRFTRNRSLYKYLRELLDFADQFICSDIGYIGYVISHPGNDTKIIAISHSAHVGGQEKEELEEKYLVHDSVNEYEDLRFFQVNPTEQEKMTCMAYCFNNQEPFLLRHYDDDDMSPGEINAKHSGHYAHFDESITAELTVPIIVDDEVKIIMNFETTEESAPTFNKVSRELLELFAKEVGIAFKDAIFKNTNTFLSLFYHAATHKIMGQYNNAVKEFDTWRQVQCQDIFHQNSFNKDLFMGFKDFYRYLASSFRCNPLATGAVYEGLIRSGVKKLFRTASLSEDGGKSLENELDFGFPFFALLKIYNLCDSNPKLKERWKNKIENIYQLIIDKSGDSQLVELPELQTVTEFSEIYNVWFDKKKKVFENWRSNNYEYMDEETFFQFYINISFLIKITEITRIQKVLEEGTALTFEELNVVSTEDRDKLHNIIITCSTLILWENIKHSKEQMNEQDEEQKLMSVPLILAHLYRGEAFLMRNEKRKAYNDFTLLERLVETRDIKYTHTGWLPSFSNKSNDKQGENFKQWLKALLKHQKGKVYFAAFAHRKALANFCEMMEMYKEFKEIIEKRKQNIPFQYVMVEAMLYKGKLFLDIGSFQRSLKWFLKGIREILPDEHKSDSLKGFPLYSLAERLLQNLIDKLEEFKHNAIIKKGDLIDKLWISKDDIIAEVQALEEIHEEKYDIGLWSEYFKSSNKKQKILLTDCLFSKFKSDPSKSKNAKLLSDFCNRIGFVIFLINLYPTENSISYCKEIEEEIQLDNMPNDNRNDKKVDIAADWIDWAIKFNPKNGFAMFNKWLIDFDRGDFNKYSNKKIKEEFRISLNQERFYRRFYPIFLHTIYKRCSKVKEPLEPFQRVAYQLSRYLLTYIDDLIKKPAEVYSYLKRDGLLEQKEPIDGLYSLERWSSWSPKLPRPRMFSSRGGGKLLIWKGKGIAIDPGFDFLTNLYEECFSLKDIDAICITHDHLDHTDEFDAICRLIKEYKRVVADEKQLVLLVNPGFSQKCGHYLKEVETKGEVKHVYILNHDSSIDLDEFCLSIKVLRALHSEQHTKQYAVGLIFQLKDENNQRTVIEIGFTGDTRYKKKDVKFYEDFKRLASCDMVVANISHATFRELKGILELKLNEDSLYQGFWNQLNEEERQNNDIIRILKWALWYGDEDNIEAIWRDETLLEQQEGKKGKGKGILSAHLGISGINNLWELMQKPSSNQSKKIEGGKLMIISEFREELGSFRSKIAQLFNSCSGVDNVRCYTSDIGMVARFEKNHDSNKYQIKIQCSFCKQDNDLNIGKTPFHSNTFHLPKEGKMDEVCVKGDNEGIFYFCENHITGPRGQFLEGIDRYSPLTLE